MFALAMTVFKYFLLIIIGMFHVAHASVIEINDDFHSKNILSNTQWLLTDTDERIGSVSSRPLAQWQSMKTPYGEVKEQALWLTFSLQGQSFKFNELFLLLNVAPSESAEIYMLDNESYVHRTYLSNQADNLFASHFPKIPLPMYTDDMVRVFVKINHKNHEPLFARITTPEVLGDWNQFQTTMVGIYVGALGILILLYFVTYIRFQDPVRFWFGVLLLSYLLMFLNQKNLLLPSLDTLLTHQQYTLWFSAAMILATHKLLSHLHAHSGRWQERRMYVACAVFCIAGLLLPEVYTNLLTVVLVVGYISTSLYQATFWQSFLSIGAARYLLLGWGCISLLNLASIGFGVYWVGISNAWYFSIFSLFTAGVILQVMGIELFDRVIDSMRRRAEESELEDLKYFYQLFKASAEGLYTSTMNGKLESVNPAMCNLFGYESEQQFFDEVSDTAQLYADPSQRSSLITELAEEDSLMGRQIKGRRRDGSEFWFSLSVQVQKQGGETFMYGSIFDISHQVENAANLEYIRQHDTITTALNYGAIENEISHALAEGNTHQVGVLHLVIDQFSIISESLGFKARDLLLRHIYQTIKNNLPEPSSIGRLGSGEFLCVSSSEDKTVFVAIAKQLVKAIRNTQISFEDHNFSPTVSIGVLTSLEDMTDVEQVIRSVESVCLSAKSQGGDQIQVYSTNDLIISQQKAQKDWFHLISQGLSENQFVLYQQGIYSLKDGQANKGYHYELLLRYNCPERGIISPYEFLQSAERFNLMGNIDRWVIQAYARWLAENPEHREALYQCNINLSANSLADESFYAYVIEIFEKHNVPWEKICFEITESQAILDEEKSLNFIINLKSKGCRFALDDFGTGFSSYDHLRKLPVNYIKIDGQFIKHLSVSDIDVTMVKSIALVAHALGINCVAEYVENQAIIRQLKLIGVDYAQGYEFSEPFPLADLVSSTD